MCYLWQLKKILKTKISNVFKKILVPFITFSSEKMKMKKHLKKKNQWGY